VLLDTSGLLCCVDASESRHQAAVTFFEAEPLKNTHNSVLVEFVALAHARKYPRHIALSFVADIATHPQYRGGLGNCPIFSKSSQLAPSF
jgi:predicted nucleic acid-binding protein